MIHIGQQINDVLLQVYAKEIFAITGRHVHREQNVFRYRPDKSRQTFLDEIEAFTKHFVLCCRGVGFNIRVKETDVGGVSVDMRSAVSHERGFNLVDRV